MSAVSEIMSTRKTVTIRVERDPSILDVTKLMLKNKMGSVVIVNRAGKPVGIVTERDVLRKISSLRRPPGEVQVKRIMSSPVVVVKAYDSVETAATIMSKKRIKRLVVMEQDGSIAGVISLTDITRKLAKILTDEHNRFIGLKAALES